jgi:hypothetical protein
MIGWKDGEHPGYAHSIGSGKAKLIRGSFPFMQNQAELGQ